jgi:hypothetical protein
MYPTQPPIDNPLPCDSPARRTPLRYRLAKRLRADRHIRDLSGRALVRSWISGYYRDPLYTRIDESPK